jgi:hypothetical protein
MVETVRQALLDQGITELQFNNVTYSVAETNPKALLYIVIQNQLINEKRSLTPDSHDYISRTTQALQMFGNTFMVDLIEDLASRN